MPRSKKMFQWFHDLRTILKLSIKAFRIYKYFLLIPPLVATNNITSSSIRSGVAGAFFFKNFVFNDKKVKILKKVDYELDRSFPGLGLGLNSLWHSSPTFQSELSRYLNFCQICGKNISSKITKFAFLGPGTRIQKT